MKKKKNKYWGAFFLAVIMICNCFLFSLSVISVIAEDTDNEICTDIISTTEENTTTIQADEIEKNKNAYEIQPQENDDRKIIGGYRIPDELLGDEIGQEELEYNERNNTNERTGIDK